MGSGLSMRVPVTNAAVCDLTVQLEHKMESVNDLMKLIDDSTADYMGVVDYTCDQVVSQDLIGNEHSCVLDVSGSFKVIDQFVKLLCWYDNENGYSCRVFDLIHYILINKKLIKE